MANKDWKIITNERTELEFKNKKNNTIIRFEKTRDQYNRYYIWAFYINENEQVEYFKTKSEALKYAKAYMTKN